MATNLPAVTNPKDAVFGLSPEMAEYVLPEYDYSKHSAGVGQTIGIMKWRKNMWFREMGRNSTLVTDEQGKPEINLQAIIVDTHPGKTRTYYDWRTDFKEGERRKPECSSDDGIMPRVDGIAVQAERCDTCPMAQWNSARGGQRGGKACKEYKTIAILPYFDVENEDYNGPMMLRVPPDSLRNWDELADRFARNKAQFHNYVVNISFDQMVPYPKLTFDVLGQADPSVMPLVMQWLNSEHLQNVLRYKPEAETVEDADPEFVQDAPTQAPAPKRTTPPQPTARPNPTASTRTPAPPPASAPARTAPPPAASPARTAPPPRPGVPPTPPAPAASAATGRPPAPKPNGQAPRPLTAVEQAKKAYEEAMAAAAAAEGADASDTAVSEDDMSTDDILSVLDEESN